MRYLEYLKSSFKGLRLNNEVDLKDERTSHPLELFFDLVFVIALGKVGHVFLSPNSVLEILVAVTLFFSVYNVWKNITKFNIYFFKEGFVSLLLFLLIMIPVIAMVSITDYGAINSIYILFFSFIISRIILFITWYVLIYRNKMITNLYMNVMSKFYSMSFLVSIIIMLFSVLNYELTYYVLMLTVFWELISNYWLSKKLNNNKNLVAPKIDATLVGERRILFNVLVWGEILTTLSSVLSEYNSVSDAIIMGIAIFLTIGLFFIRILISLDDHYVSHRNNVDIYPKFLAVIDYISPLVSLAMFISMIGISLSNEINIISKVIDILGLFYINIGHLVLNLKTQKVINLDQNMQYFFYIDNKLLIVQLFITLLLIFVTSSYLFIFLMLLIFFLHIIAAPIRYGKTEYF